MLCISSSAMKFTWCPTLFNDGTIYKKKPCSWNSVENIFFSMKQCCWKIYFFTNFI